MKAKLTLKTIEALKPQDKTYEVRDTETPGFLLKVSPTGGMGYFCDYRRPDGRRTRIKLGDARVLTPAQARDEARKVLGERAKGEDPARARKTARQETLESFIDRQYGPWAKSHRKTGVQTVERLLSRFAEFKTTRLSDISFSKVEKWRCARLNSGNVASTVNRNVAMLKAALQKAADWELIESNPLKKVRPLRIDQTPNIRYLDESEELQLRGAMDAREARIRLERRSYNVWLAERGLPLLPDLGHLAFADYLKPMILLSMNTGIRRGEMFDLKWREVDIGQRTITIMGGTAKSGRTRHIPLNEESLRTLTLWRAQSDATSDLVFPSFAGERFDNINNSWKALLALAGIVNLRWHDLRHHFASMLVIRGVDLNTVRELLGHTDLKMTIRYAHLAPQVKANAVAKLDTFRIKAA